MSEAELSRIVNLADIGDWDAERIRRAESARKSSMRLPPIWLALPAAVACWATLAAAGYAAWTWL